MGQYQIIKASECPILVTPAKAGVQNKNPDSGPVFQRGKLKIAGMTVSGYLWSGKSFSNE